MPPPAKGRAGVGSARLHMLDPAFDLFLLARVEGARIRAAEIAAHPAGHRHLGRVMVAAARAGEALGGALELAGEAAVVALVDGVLVP